VAIEGEILGVGHGKMNAFGGRQEDGKGRKVFFGGRKENFGGERGISAEELRAWWLVLLIFFRCVRN
jgi:hypothetical protein